jgi:4-amino-4-deoxy-L-arabinose transferase-like glycosyltransferase
MARIPARSSWLALALLVALFGARLLHTATQNSFTIDEPHYAATGLYLWRSGDYDWLLTLRMQPPLAFHLASLPLLAIDSGRLGSRRGSGLAAASHPGAPPARLRMASRLPFVLLSCWGALLVFLWAREVAGDRAGLLALFLFSFSPTVAAYAPLAHSDMAFAIFFLQTFYTLWRWWRAPGALRLALCGLSAGLAAATKISGLTLVPMLGAIFAVLVLRPGADAAPPRVRLRRAALALAGIGGIGLGVLWLSYGGSFRIEPGSLGPFRNVPLPGYLRALQGILEVNAADHYFWFFGANYSEAPRWVLPAGFLVKTPLPLLLLAAAALLRRRADAFQAARLALFLGLPFAIYAGIAVGIARIPHGVRYLLPLYPLLFVAIGTRLADLADLRARAGVALACAWLGVVSVAIHPHYLAYVNELVGGPRRAHLAFADTNLDWGQDVITLSRWLAERGNPPVHTALFAVESPRAYGAQAFRIAGCRPVHSGLVAISASVLHGIRSPTLVGRPPPGCYAWLEGREPVAEPGYSILVYDLGSR